MVALKTLALASVATAHFVLNYPTSRGFDDELEPQAPCGGFNTVNSTRSSFQLSGGQYQINSRHATANVEVHFSSNGQNFSSQAVQSYTITGLGTACLSLPQLSGYSAGDNATLQVVYRAASENEALYQCADIVLTSDRVTPTTCTNATNIQISQLVNNGGGGSGGSSASSSVGTRSTASANSSSARSGSAAAPTAAATSARTSGAGALLGYTAGGAALLAAVAVVL